jgi:hypothetical protein
MAWRGSVLGGSSSPVTCSFPRSSLPASPVKRPTGFRSGLSFSIRRVKRGKWGNGSASAFAYGFFFVFLVGVECSCWVVFLISESSTSKLVDNLVCVPSLGFSRVYCVKEAYCCCLDFWAAVFCIGLSLFCLGGGNSYRCTVTFVY